MPGSSQCPHSDVHYHLNLASFGDTNLRYVELTGHCKLCNAKMLFRGPIGMGPDFPAVSVGREEIRLPLMFDGDEQLTGNPMGFSIRGPL